MSKRSQLNQAKMQLYIEVLVSKGLLTEREKSLIQTARDPEEVREYQRRVRKNLKAKGQK